VANLVPRKGIVEFLREVASRTDDADRFHLDVVGRDDIDPGYARTCRELVSASAALARRVHFAGAVPRAGVDAFYRRAGVFVSPARMETFGMALQEARAFCLPILAFDGGHARAHFTHGHDGLLFSSFEGLAAGFLELARDDGKMRALFDRAMGSVSKPAGTWESAAETLLEQLGPWLANS
jgi:glycosyltransferase involved in cell wall biosynthesis